MRPDGMGKPSELPSSYEEFFMHERSRGPDVRHVQSRMPWWNPRYWRKRVWLGVAALVVIVIIIAVAAGVAESKKNSAYPDYTDLNYSLADTYEGTSFFDNFDYFTGYDPAQGFVHYVPQAEAQALNLTYASANSATLRVDTSVGPNSVPNASTGRFSVRVQSKKQYNDGLFIFDVIHTPYACAAWPALWLTDPSNWPTNGEIDVMESVNQGTNGNQMTLHTTAGCSMGVKREETATVLTKNCDAYDSDNAGCGVDGKSDSFGAALNSAGGAIVALEWRNAGIRMWQFPHDSAPADITSASPTPNSWGTATADFPSTDCDISSHFKNQSIIVNIDLCGTLTNSVWAKSGCSSNCTDIVANQPDNFKTAYWEFGKFHVYQAS